MTVDETTWLYVAVQKTGATERIVGQTDTAHDISFIPAFRSKETAQQALVHLHLERGGNYEVQAIIYEDLARHALENGCVIFVLNAEGQVITRLPASP